MKKGKLIIGICLLVVAFVLSIKQTVYAVEPINLDGFEDMPSTTSTTPEVTTQPTTTTTTEKIKNEDDKKTETTNKSAGSEAKTKMPQTGSNSLAIFVSGTTILVVGAAIVFKKFINIKLQ